MSIVFVEVCNDGDVKQPARLKEEIPTILADDGISRRQAKDHADHCTRDEYSGGCLPCFIIQGSSWLVKPNSF